MQAWKMDLNKVTQVAKWVNHSDSCHNDVSHGPDCITYVTFPYILGAWFYKDVRLCARHRSRIISSPNASGEMLPAWRTAQVDMPYLSDSCKMALPSEAGDNTPDLRSESSKHVMVRLCWHKRASHKKIASCISYTDDQISKVNFPPDFVHSLALL